MGNKLIPEGKWSRITLLWSFAQFILISIMEFIIILLNIRDKKYLSDTLKDGVENNIVIGNYNALIVYQVLFIAALAYQLYSTVDTLLKFSTIDLIALAAFNSMCLIYSFTQLKQTEKIFNNIDDEISEKGDKLNKDTTQYLIKINMGLMVVFTFGWWYITFKLYKIFGWNVFKQIGADINLKKRLKMFNILMALLKLTFFFINILFLVQYITSVMISDSDDEPERTFMWYVKELAIPFLGIICTAVGFYAMKKESRFLLGIYIFTLCAVMGFISSVLTELNNGKNEKKYKNFFTSLNATIIFTLILCLITYCVSLINFKNFGLGIPKSINKNKNTVQSNQAERTQQKRLSID